ncbi:MAG: response regulator [Chitinivibrionales bacterium]|nr:response regulator [Chitinivibrionales bacterium]
MITTLIADDEKHARERFRELLERFAEFDIVAEATDGNEALSAIIAHKPQVAFLDINMPGISVFTSISSLQNPPLVVFQTAYSEHAADAFDIDALDYLLKPVRYERLERTVARIREKLAVDGPMTAAGSAAAEQPVQRVTIKSSGKTRVIAASDIVRISFTDGFCYLYTLTEKLISDKYLNHYEEKLRGGRFFRASRTDLINLDHIAAIRRIVQGMYCIELKNGMQVDLSRRKAQLLRKLIDF